MIPQFGDKVKFHFDSSGTRRIREALVVYVKKPYEADPDLEMIDLVVEFTDEDFADGSSPAGLQMQICKALDEKNPESGSWTW